MPPSPVDVDQVTSAIPWLDCAVPLTTMELAEVATVVIAGERIFNDGDAVLGVGLVGGGFGGGLGEGFGLSAGGNCSVTITLWEARSCFASEAVTVITLTPGVRGTAGMVQVAEPCAVPADP